jgi:hypothetical protein
MAGCVGGLLCHLSARARFSPRPQDPHWEWVAVQCAQEGTKTETTWSPGERSDPLKTVGGTDLLDHAGGFCVRGPSALAVPAAIDHRQVGGAQPGRGDPDEDFA